MALEQGYEDPVNPDYDATTAMYYRVADLFLDEVKGHQVKDMGNKLQVTFATHNAETVQYALDGWIYKTAKCTLLLTGYLQLLL